MLNLNFSLLFLISNVEAQSITKYYYRDSIVSAMGNLVNGKPEGLWKNFYENSQLKSLGNWKHNLLDSTWLFYFPNGQIQRKIQYSNGIKNGYTYTYKLNKQQQSYLYKEELFIDGKLTGDQIIYYSNGKTQKVIKYQQGNKIEHGITFDSVGNPNGLITYRNNKAFSYEAINQKDSTGKIGKWIELNSNFNIQENKLYQKGKLITKSKIPDKNLKYTIAGLEQKSQDTLFGGQFVDGIPVGTHLQFDSTGNPISYKEYDSIGRLIEKGYLLNLVKNSTVIGYYPNQKIKYTGKYLKGYKHGRWKFFYQEGTLEQIGNYYYNKPHKKWIWFYKTNDTLKVENYFQGKLDGYYVSYDPYGQVIKKGYYYNNQKQNQWIINTGTVYFKGNFFDDLKDSIWIGKYQDNQLAFKGKYIRGNKVGKHTYFYSNGKKRKIEFYTFDKPVGYWQFYNKNGILYKIKSFKKEEELFIK